MGKDSTLIRTILFNILVILTILFIYILFFPKKSYIKEKLEQELNPFIEETFKDNINSLTIAGETYFSSNNNSKVTVEELINKNLLAELRDSNGESCSNSSYIEKTDNKTIIHLECKDKSDEIIINELKETNEIKEKYLCIYQYEKTLPSTYTNWSNWSNWDTNKIEKNELTNVETKTEKESDGTKTVTNTREISINATENTKLSCREGYILLGNKCKNRIENNSIKATLSYSCPEGYNRTGVTCYKGSLKIEASKNYYCPDNQGNIEYELSGDTCHVFTVKGTESPQTQNYYTCPSGYKISNDKCYKIEEYTKKIDNYKEVTYYRYQTREKENEKIDIKWSTPNDKKLLNQEYNMVGKITCEF